MSMFGTIIFGAIACGRFALVVLLSRFFLLIPASEIARESYFKSSLTKLDFVLSLDGLRWVIDPGIRGGKLCDTLFRKFRELPFGVCSLFGGL